MNNQSEQAILIVDDNPKNLQLLGSILKENGYKVEFATNGTEALEWLDDQEFDLVLLDIMMPGMDGYLACRKIREKVELNDMPIIFLTAKTAKESIVKGFQSGAQDYITKPFNTNELLARVDTHLELRSSKIKLRDVNAWLESKVAERTAQLESANRQLSSLDKAKTEFLNLIGHEIRTPLNGIIGPMQLIRSDSRDPEIDLMLGLMEVSVGRLENFAYQALLISNLRTGKYLLKPERVNLSELFIDIGKKLTPILDKSNTELVLNVEESTFAIGDRVLFEECFEKLIENSLQYLKKEGDLLVNTFEKDGFIEIHISDRRIKFSDTFLDNMQTLFDPGGEYSDSNLGIGMVLVNLVLNAHNATIEMLNFKKSGATLVVKIPHK